MIDPVNGSSLGRTQSTSQTNAVRATPVTLNAVAQTSQRVAKAVAPVTALAVPQGVKSGNTSNTKVPRGSLVDVLA